MIKYLLNGYPQLTAFKFCNRVQFSPRYEPIKMSIQGKFAFSWTHFTIGNFIDKVSDWQISCTFKDNEKVNLESKCPLSSEDIF